MSLATAAHKLAPDSAEVSGVLGHLVYRTGDYVWALSLLENAADRLPNRPDLLYDLAWAYYAVGRIGDAESTMQKALQTGVEFSHSNDAKSFVELAAAVADPSQVQAKAGEAAKILQTEPKYVPALSWFRAWRMNARAILVPPTTPTRRRWPPFPCLPRQPGSWHILDASYFTDDPHGLRRRRAGPHRLSRRRLGRQKPRDSQLFPAKIQPLAAESVCRRALPMAAPTAKCIIILAWMTIN